MTLRCLGIERDGMQKFSPCQLHPLAPSLTKAIHRSIYNTPLFVFTATHECEASHAALVVVILSDPRTVLIHQRINTNERSTSRRRVCPGRNTTLRPACQHRRLGITRQNVRTKRSLRISHLASSLSLPSRMFAQAPSATLRTAHLVFAALLGTS